MKYNTYDVINGGPRLVEIAKHRGKRKALHFRKKEAFSHILFLFYFLEIYKKRPKVRFFFYCFLLTPFNWMLSHSEEGEEGLRITRYTQNKKD